MLSISFLAVFLEFISAKFNLRCNLDIESNQINFEEFEAFA